MEIFKTEKLTFTYPLKNQPALNDLNLSIKQGTFLTICGQSGCGKTTLLRHFKSALTPYGDRSGNILLNGVDISDVDMRTQTTQVGYVLQNPDNQIVTDKVWHELAFGLESLGYDNKTIRLRVAEMASFFGIQTWFMKNVSELSGGQKQLLNLASIMAMQPSALILDEPTSQLDPIAASDFLSTVKKINQELGTTIIITEHRLEDVLPISDRAIVMDSGRIIADGAPHEVGKQLAKMRHSMFVSMPTPVQIYSGVSNNLPCPITVRDGRLWISELLPEKQPLSSGESVLQKVKKASPQPKREPIIELKGVWFKYDKNSLDVVSDLSLKIYKGEFYCILGGNGSGKTTTLSIINGISKAYRGKVLIGGKNISKIPSQDLYEKNLVMLPQNPQTLFVRKTVAEDLFEILPRKLSAQEKRDRVDSVAKLVDIERLLEQHPYDLSGGEQQRAALAKILLLEPKIILLDEPTKGLDGEFKQKLAEILNHLKENGATIVMVCHDIEFAAKYADRCAMFFNGNIVAENDPSAFFSGNKFYTTAANRMARHIFPGAISVEEVTALCNRSLAEAAAL